MTHRIFISAIAVLSLVAAACSGNTDDTASPATAPATARTNVESTSTADTTITADTTLTAATIDVTTTATDTTTTIDPIEITTIDQVNEYVAQAATFDQVGADAQFPAGLTFSAGGAPGYSRYVFRENSGGVVPTLVEGPLRDTVRCQDEALPCSFQDLLDLRDGGSPIPDALEMDEAELSDLVDQLSELHEFARAHSDVDSACADGYVSDRIQTPNMGSHFYSIDAIVDGFDPGRPEILLYALADGTMPNGALGQCENGAWVGEPLVLVGTAFLIPPAIIGNDHPETFAGPLDNWHIHYNLCRGNEQGRDTFLPRSECEAQGGNFSPALGWMLHAWVADGFDNQLGVFSMWNSAIQPVADADTILADREVRGSDFPDGAEQSLIADFGFGGSLAVHPGQPLFFNNVDAVPHTVTAGTPTKPILAQFDSGLLTPGSNFAVTFDDPGVYSLFCSLHPDMTATVTVTD